MGEATPTKFIRFAPYLLTAAFATYSVRIEAVRDPGVRLGRFMVRTLMTHSTQFGLHLLREAVFGGLDSKQSAVRAECAEYLEFIIGELVKQKQNGTESESETEMESELVAQLESAVRSACKDAAAEARMNGYRALQQFEAIAPETVKGIKEVMTK